MIFRLALLFLCAAMLSACGHLPSKRATSDEQTATLEPTTEPQRADTASSASDQEQKIEIVTREVATAEPAATTASNLLDRIRDGFALPDFNSKHIRQYEKWNSQHPSYLRDLFARAEPFLFYIVEEIEKRGMPMEVALLPAVESAFKPKANSRSGAAGLWQFIPSTGKHYGLRQDWWYDGRRDAIASTTAALDYLQELNTLFKGDWLLTFAAYNAGQGTVLRAIKRNQKKRRGTRYQDLNLRTETVRYVPKLYALRNIILAPKKYRVTLPVIPNRQYFEVVNLPGQVDIVRFAQASQIDLETLKHMNAGNRRWATSPLGPHRMLIPLSASDAVAKTLATIKLQPAIKYQDHAIRRGETLSSIARKYGVSVAALQQVNGLRSTSIRAGKTMLIPIASKAGSPLVSSNANAYTGSTAAENKILHKVVSGDTLWSIARRYSVKVSELLSWNKLSANQVLNLNQSLLVFLN